MADEINKIRVSLKARRNMLSQTEVKRASDAACKQLIQLEAFKQAHTFAAYLALGQEIDPMGVIQTGLQKSKQVYAPVVTQTQLRFAPYTEGCAIKTNNFGIKEPDCSPQNYKAISLLDLVVIPLVAFDQQGNRIGMGAGYYDRALANCQKHSPIKIGFAYDWQCTSGIQPQAWDIPMDYIVTDKSVYSITPSK